MKTRMSTFTNNEAFILRQTDKTILEESSQKFKTSLNRSQKNHVSLKIFRLTGGRTDGRIIELFNSGRAQ